MQSYLFVVEVGAAVAFVGLTVMLVIAVSRKDKITFTVIQ